MAKCLKVNEMANKIKSMMKNEIKESSRVDFVNTMYCIGLLCLDDVTNAIFSNNHIKATGIFQSNMVSIKVW